MDAVTEKIANYAASTRFDHLTAEAAHAATQRLIDSIGCALGAFDCEPAQIGRRLASGQAPGKYAGRVLCFGDNLPAESAAFINTAMIRNFDFNDRYPGGHPSDCLGALLALAGSMQVDGKSLLASMIVVYEIFARLSDATTLSRRGWDQGYAIGIATAAGVCNLLKLSADVTAHAVGIAATSNLPLRVTRSGELTPWKNVATAYAARNGLFAALLAAEGMSGPGSAFEGRNGLWEKVTGPFDLTPFPDQGGVYLTPRVQLKYWPIETNGQAAVWAALELRAKTKADELREIEVFTSKFTWFEIGSEPEKWDPEDARNGGSQLAVYFCPSAGRRTHSRFFIQRRGRSRSGATAVDAKDQSDSGRCHRSSAAGKSLDSSGCDDARRRPAYRRSGKSIWAIPTIRCKTTTSKKNLWRWRNQHWAKIAAALRWKVGGA